MTLSLSEIARRYESGQTIGEIHSATGMARSTIRNRLNEMGVPIRPRCFRPHLVTALAEFDRLDALSRTRALTDSESMALEEWLNVLLHSNSYGLRIELAKRGLLKVKLREGRR